MQIKQEQGKTLILSSRTVMENNLSDINFWCTDIPALQQTVLIQHI